MHRVLVALIILAVAASPALAGGAGGGVVNKGGIATSPNGPKPDGSTDGRGVGGIVSPNGSNPGVSVGGGSGVSPNGSNPSTSRGGDSGPVKPFAGKGGISGDVHK
jgi:hypothetical protein